MALKNGNIIRDPVSRETFKALNYASACEDCSHFDSLTLTCTFGFPVEDFLRAKQIADVEEKGEMAFCRAIEID